MNCSGVKQKENCRCEDQSQQQKCARHPVVKTGKQPAPGDSGNAEQHQYPGDKSVRLMCNLFEKRFNVTVGCVIRGRKERGEHVNADEKRIVQERGQVADRKRIAARKFRRGKLQIKQNCKCDDADTQESHSPADLKSHKPSDGESDDDCNRTSGHNHSERE